MTEVQRSAPFTAQVQVSTGGDIATAVNLYIDGVSAGSAPVQSGNIASFSFPDGLPVAKSYNLTAAGVNVAGEGPTVALTLVVKANVPNAPIFIQVIQ